MDNARDTATTTRIIRDYAITTKIKILRMTAYEKSITVRTRKPCFREGEQEIFKCREQERELGQFASNGPTISIVTSYRGGWNRKYTCTKRIAWG